MDLLAHALYGATFCSRTGLAGGLRGRPPAPRRAWRRDASLWWAIVFGVLPDLASMGVPFVVLAVNGTPGPFLHDFFHGLDAGAIVIYRLFHSLLTALLVCAALWLARPRLFVASLAWPLHLLMDSVSHGLGKYQTTLFYPLSDWALDGIRWWMSPRFVMAYWCALPTIWTALHLARSRPAAGGRMARHGNAEGKPA